MAWKKTKVGVNCAACRKEIEVFKSLYEKRTSKTFYCSYKCSNIGHTKKLDTSCAYCGKLISVIPSHFKKFKNAYCSSECSGCAKTKERVKIECSWCGKEVERLECSIKQYEKTFCDMKCYADWKRKNLRYRNNPMWKQKISIKCAWCGKELRTSKCFEGTTSFCSRGCSYSWRADRYSGSRNPNWNGGTSYDDYGLEFNSTLKRKIKLFWNETCAICGISSSIICIHHIDYDKKNNNILNLIALCRSCHSKTNCDRSHWEAFLKDLNLQRLSRKGVHHKPMVVEALGIRMNSDDDIVCSHRQL